MELGLLDVTPQKLSQLKSKFSCIEEIVKDYPVKYIDYRYLSDTEHAASNSYVAIRVRVLNVTKNNNCVKAVCVDARTCEYIRVMWFTPYRYSEVFEYINEEVYVCGKYVVHETYGRSFDEPDFFTPNKDVLKIHPIYKKVKGMSNEYRKRVSDDAIKLYLNQKNYSDFIPKDILDKFNNEDNYDLCSEKELIYAVHHPSGKEDIKKANRRMIFESMYTLAKMMVSNSGDNCEFSPFRPLKLTNCNNLKESLPYELTKDQVEIVAELINSAKQGRRIQALIQGDVGTGKTICAFLLMFAMSDNGYQSVLMAPTGVLAKQHYIELKGYADKFGLKTVFLSGDMKKTEKKVALKEILEGADFVVGTHSVISEDVVFKNLGLTVVDEEHKFGVVQRDAIKKKANEGVHSITMSATPIPRSLAIALYDDRVQVCSISTKPKGRLPIKTCVTRNFLDIYNLMHQEIKNNHQCYVVCPSIESSDYIDDNENAPLSVSDVYTNITDFFENVDSSVKVSVITGKMKEADKNQVIEDFKNNRSQILIATTIIEVGVNVPNATVMAVMNADRYGLAGLHQLRGRVGRNSLQSYCILHSEDVNNKRLEVLCDTTDGFKVAEADLNLRGTGDICGTRQSGDNKQVLLMSKFPNTFAKIKECLRKGDEFKR